MAKKANQLPKGSEALSPEALDKVLESIRELITTHNTEMGTVIEESEGRKLRINLGLDVDRSESAPQIDVTIRFSAAVTDKRSIRCDDPNQMTFTSLTAEELEERNKAMAAKDAEAQNGSGDPDEGNPSGGEPAEKERKPRTRKPKK